MSSRPARHSFDQPQPAVRPRRRRGVRLALAALFLLFVGLPFIAFSLSFLILGPGTTAASKVLAVVVPAVIALSVLVRTVDIARGTSPGRQRQSGSWAFSDSGSWWSSSDTGSSGDCSSSSSSSDCS